MTPRQKMLCYLLVMLSPSIKADVLGLSNPAELANHQGWAPYASAHYFNGVDYVAAKSFSNNWDGAYTPRNGANLSLLSAHAETGITYNDWRLTALYRQDQLIESNRDTTDMVYFNKQHLPIPAGRNFIAQLRIEGFEAKGVKLEKAFDLASNEAADLFVGLGFSVLQGTKVRLSQLDGTATSTAAGYTYNVGYEDSYSRATYPFIRPGSPQGSGYSFDVGAKITWFKGASLDFAVNDLFGKMTWRDMPHTIATANTQNVARDANGFIYFNPTISGVNDVNRRTIVQRLPAKAHTQFNYQLSDWNLFAGSSWTQGYWFPDIGATYQVNEEWKTSLDLDTRFKSIGLGIRHKLGGIALRSSSTSLGKANAYGVNAELRIDF